jgi:hypothetical protein
MVMGKSDPQKEAQAQRVKEFHELSDHGSDERI